MRFDRGTGPMGFYQLRRHRGAVPFSDVPWPQRQQVQNAYDRFLAAHKAKHKGGIPHWLRGLLGAVARRVTLGPPLMPSQARKMAARRAGLASAAAARRRGLDPLAVARAVLASRRRRGGPGPVALSSHPMKVSSWSVVQAPASGPPLLSDELIARKRMFDHVHKLGTNEP